jgi:hypothetical protein
MPRHFCRAAGGLTSLNAGCGLPAENQFKGISAERSREQRMGWSLGVFIAVVIGSVGWFGYEVFRLLKQIADELRHIRRYLEGVSGELEKISGPLGYVQKIYGLGERVLGRNEKK